MGPNSIMSVTNSPLNNLTIAVQLKVYKSGEKTVNLTLRVNNP